MPLLIGLAAGAVTGGARTLAQNAKADQQKLIQSNTTRYSPWTRMAAKDPEYADPFGNILGGAGSGLLMGKEFGGGAAEETPPPNVPEASNGPSVLPGGLGANEGYQDIKKMAGIGTPGSNMFMPAGGGGSSWDKMNRSPYNKPTLMAANWNGR